MYSGVVRLQERASRIVNKELTIVSRWLRW